MSRIVIVGAGGHGAVVADILLAPSPFPLPAGERGRGEGTHAIGFVDDAATQPVLGLPILGPIAALRDIEHDAILVAIGDNRRRRELTERLAAAGEQLATAIHPFASVAASVSVGAGSMICAGAIVLPRAVIGRGVILNTKCSVDHDGDIGDFAHIAPGATLGGNVRIGEETLVGTGASVIAGTTVGARTTIGAGAAVVRNIPGDVTALGVPARITSDRRSETRR